eukprot:bmy_00158T0
MLAAMAEFRLSTPGTMGMSSLPPPVLSANCRDSRLTPLLSPPITTAAGTRHGKWAVCQEVAGGAGRRGAQTGGAPSSLTPPPVGSKGQDETPPHPGVLNTGHRTKCSYSFPTSHTPSASINVETTLPGLYRCIPRPHLLSEVSTMRQVGPILDVLKFHLNEANTFQLLNGQLLYVFQTAKEENFGHSTSLESICNQPTTFQQDLPLLFPKWPGLNYCHHTAVGGNKKTASCAGRSPPTGGERSRSRCEEERETRKLDKPQEHITSAFCLQGKPYHSEAPTLPRCWGSGMGTPDATASVAARGDWPLPPPSEAASRDRASVPRPDLMETPLSRGCAAAPGPSAARRVPKSAPPAATVAWPNTRTPPSPPSSPEP